MIHHYDQPKTPEKLPFMTLLLLVMYLSICALICGNRIATYVFKCKDTSFDSRKDNKVSRIDEMLKSNKELLSPFATYLLTANDSGTKSNAIKELKCFLENSETEGEAYS